jgi:AraC-like DNA-binding protein
MAGCFIAAVIPVASNPRDLLLGQRGLTIDEIAVKTGFSSGSHLAAAFRRATGYSPAEFRRQAL